MKPVCLFFCVLATATLVSTIRSSAAGAQEATARISGRVVSRLGPLPGVTVTARQGALLRESTSGADGTFMLSALPPGTYEVTAALFGLAEQERIEVSAGETRVIDFALRAGSCSENITAPGDHPVVDSRSLPHLFAHIRIHERFIEFSPATPNCGIRYRATLLDSVRLPGPPYSGPSGGSVDVFLDVHSLIEIGKEYVILLNWNPYMNGFESAASKSETVMGSVENGRVNYSVDELFGIFEGLFNR